MPNSTPYLKSVEDVKNLMITSLPNGFLYNENEGINKILQGFATGFFDEAKKIQKHFDDLFTITAQNQYLERFLGEYGLPNVIFPDIANNTQAAFAISAMKQVEYLETKEDYENFLLLLGVRVNFYHYQNTMLDHHKFPYTLPMILGGVPPKNKITWLVEIIESVSSDYNLNKPTPMILYNPSADTLFAKKVLDYLKPDYILFQYIDSETKSLYGIS